MGRRRRSRVGSTDDWEQLELLRGVEQRVKNAKGGPAVGFLIDGEVYGARQRATERPSGRSRGRA